MFDITGQDISLLSDEDLRALVGRLCEAELRERGLSAVAVTWGGDQSAPDGGIDVRVERTGQPSADGPLCSTHVGFQVKAEDMPRRKILAEMRPSDSVRASIRDLAKLGGTYIVVSSKGSVSDTSLSERKRAMRDAVVGIDNADDLHLDFYDRNRLATWARDKPSLVTWIREKVGRPLSGWRPYGDWSGSREDTSGTYLLDDSLRIQASGGEYQTLSAIQGLNNIRKVLAAEQGVVRLVGLSGVGKTRLAQALFDIAVGEHPLGEDLAVYANISSDLNPQPIAVATELVSLGSRQILVVDNCPPDLHSKLSEVCRRVQSRVSLLTIEYDVREDLPEGTDVFELRPASDTLIEQLLLRRVKGLSRVNATSISRFASGNARVALALANTVDVGESVASLRDVELFERLFRQRHEANSSLLASAQACSLAYSFQGEDVTGNEEAELPKLAAVIGKDVRSLHVDVGELKRRDLVQQRGVWRALLPHAIANRLASLAYESCLPSDLQDLFSTAPPRLLKSISRRLGYLHTSEAARRITREWLAEGGMLSRLENLNELGMAMLTNIAPVDPVAAVNAIERAMLRCRAKREELVGEEFRRLLLSLAFNRDHFDRCISLLLELIEDELPGRFANQVRNSFSFTLPSPLVWNARHRRATHQGSWRSPAFAASWTPRVGVEGARSDASNVALLLVPSV